MAAEKTVAVEDPKLTKLVRVYLKMKEKNDEIANEYKEKTKELSNQMVLVKSALLDYCKEHGVEGARTKSGLFYRTTTTNYWTNDWAAMHEFVLEHGMPDLLEKRLHQGNVKAFLEDNPDVLPPGMNTETKYQISIRRK
jgi:hypothetical protein